jgi:hypothetical protein
VCRVGGVVLDPELAEPEALSQPVGAHQRRQPGLERIAWALCERQEVRVAPDPCRARLNLAAQLVCVGAFRIVGHLERTKARVAHVARVERVLGGALLALQGGGCHFVGILQFSRL